MLVLEHDDSWENYVSGKSQFQVSSSVAILSFSLSAFLKTGVTFSILSFSGKTVSSRMH